MQGVVPCRLEKMKMTAKKKSVKKSVKKTAKKTAKKTVKKTAKKTVKKLPVKRNPIGDDWLLAIMTKVFGPA